MNPYIATYHIGGRNGSGGLPYPGKFASDVISIMFDADAGCVEEAEKKTSAAHKKLILPYCVHKHNGSGKFHINYDPFSSSCLVLDDKFANHYLEFGDMDYVFGECLKPVRELTLEMKNLRTIVDEVGPGVPPPDFLSVDAEGLEYEIFEGAGDLLDDEILAIVTEIQMQPVHTGQKIFGDTCRLLGGKGFFFARFMDLSPGAAWRYPIGVRGEGIPLHGDALFLRHIESITDGAKSVDQCFVKLRKAAFIALQFGYLEYALECLKAAGRLDPGETVRAVIAEMPYSRALDEIAAAAESMPKRFPKTFAQTFTQEEAYQRGVAGEKNPHTGVKRLIKAFLIEHPGLLSAVRAVRAAIKTARAFGLESWERLFAPETPLEAALRKHDMNEVADLVAGKRKSTLKAIC